MIWSFFFFLTSFLIVSFSFLFYVFCFCFMFQTAVSHVLAESNYNVYCCNSESVQNISSRFEISLEPLAGTWQIIRGELAAHV